MAEDSKRVKIGKHLSVEEIPNPGRKTRRFTVINHTLGEEIAVVEWDGGWRQYVMDDGALKISAGCHTDLAKFLSEQNEIQRLNRGKR